MRIAVTYDNGQIWQHFGKTEFFKSGHGALADFLAENKVDAVICGGVGSPMIGRLEGYGIKAYPGVTGDADQAVTALLSGTLKTDEAAVHSGCHHHS